MACCLYMNASVKESISFFDEKMSGRKWNLRLIIRYGSLKFDITNLRFARKTIKVSFEIVFLKFSRYIKTKIKTTENNVCFHISKKNNTLYDLRFLNTNSLS